MNTGVEACESAVKIARRWGYVKKNIPDNQATVLFAYHNYHGRTIAFCGASEEEIRYKGLGPFGGLNFEMINYNDANALEAKLKSNPNISAFIIEPIQGEAGIIIPELGYLKKVREICTKHKVLFICDEIQTGLGRTGRLLDYHYEAGVKPDIVTLAKSLSGGFMPISAILADNDVMNVIKPGEHGSTFGGNPLACAIAKASIEVLIEEKLV